MAIRPQGNQAKTTVLDRPVAIKRPGKPARLNGGPGRQYAALPFRYHHSLEILLISSRETRRWVIPKGWPMKGRKPHAAAATEALQEAGVEGIIAKRSIGFYQYVKRLKNGAPLLCTVEVFPMMVARQRARWPEQHERTVQWFPAEEAAIAVQEPELRALIDAFTATGRKPNEDRDVDHPAGAPLTSR
jgi:8-oxo-dGTP pyrophosphatase MutT (NUDIX family)